MKIMFDFSLYPSVTACTESEELYPVAYPQIILGPEIKEFCQTVGLENAFGFVHCKVLPPKNLKIPSVPMLINDKLMFVLCYKCAQTKSETPCTHSAEERALTVHIATPEVS